MIGETATLELTPEQARAVSVAVARGEVSLVLRSLSDNEGGPVLINGGESQSDDTMTESLSPRRGQVTLIRYGHAQQVALAGEE